MLDVIDAFILKPLTFIKGEGWRVIATQLYMKSYVIKLEKDMWDQPRDP